MSYTDRVSPKKVQEAVNRGYKRLGNFRRSRLMFLRNYCGQYYDKMSGTVGTEALNLIFNAIRVLVPNIVLSFPTHKIETPYLTAKEYGDLLGLALAQHDKQISIRDIYRRVIVDAIFTVGLMKTGLASSNTIYAFNDEDSVDAGTIYTEAVDFDNWVVDPNSREHLFKDAAFMGDRLYVPRQQLLDSGLYKNDLIERLPRSEDAKVEKAFQLTMNEIHYDDNVSLEDEVEITEIWVPSANAIITVPGTSEIVFDDYLRVDDYYGVAEGPYTLLTLTPPVPGNPLPIPMVGIWNDLHVLANRMAKKIVEQAERQKDIVGYKRSAADDAEEVRNAGDGEAIAMDDPDGIKTYSFGGQQTSNEQHLQQLQMWFNQMAGNPAQMGGQDVPARSATAATIMQSNAGIGLEDMKDLVYQSAAAEGRRRAWYLHTDPLLQMPLTRRQYVPPQYLMAPTGPIQVSPPSLQDVQVVLTPEARKGEFIDFMFSIEPESMGRQDSKTRFIQAIDFATKVMPSVVATAQAFMQLGIPFNALAFLLRMAKDAGIDWLAEIIYDPNFQMQMQMMLMNGPQASQSKGIPSQSNPQSMGQQVAQNGQLASLPASPPSPQTQQKQTQQGGANLGQSIVKREVLKDLTGATNY